MMGGEGQFDQRLFNSSKGMDSGFGDDEAYNVYDRPWREASSMASHIYRPSKNLNADESLTSRSGPIEFERQEEDPFGLDQFLTQAKRAPTKRARDERTKDDGRSNKRRA